MDTDVVIVGGGTAGLQAALTLGRMRFDVVVVDAGDPANAPAHAIGGLLGAHDLAPLTLLETGRAQLAELPTVRIVTGTATRIDPGLVTVGSDELRCRAVILATGMTYTVPDVPGLAELWGSSVIHCPFCHGWESRDQRIALLSTGPEHEGHLVPLLSRLSGDIEVFTEIAELRGDRGALRAVVPPDGTEVERDVLFVAAPPVPRDAPFAHLDLASTGPGLIEVEMFGQTSVPGIYAAGDLVTPAPAVVQALSSGQRAAVGVTRDLTVV